MPLTTSPLPSLAHHRPHRRAGLRTPSGRARAYLQATPTGLLLMALGELDVQTAPWFDALLHHTEHPLCELTMDLSGIAFVDCAGITPILGSRRRRTGTEHPLHVQRTGAAVARLADLLGVTLTG